MSYKKIYCLMKYKIHYLYTYHSYNTIMKYTQLIQYINNITI